MGKLDVKELGLWIDYAFLLICGGIPWQVYFQRVLSSTSAKRAKILSFVAAGGCIVSVIPAILIGALAQEANWEAVLPPNSTYLNFTHHHLTNSSRQLITDKRLVLPMVLQYMTNDAIAFIGLGAVSAAVMSSADSSVLSASSMFAYNIYTVIFRRNASAKETIWVLRAAIVVVGVLATVVGLTVESIYDLFHLCSDLVYVCLFPQLLCAVHVPWVNTYGSAAAMLVGMIFRLTGGEPIIGLPAAIKWPMYDYKKDKQLFPFRTFSMLLSLGTLLLGSHIANVLIKNGTINQMNDYFKVIERKNKLPEKQRRRIHGGAEKQAVQMSKLEQDNVISNGHA